MKICVYGCGFQGLPIVCALAMLGHKIVCIDKNDYRIENNKKGIIDIYEQDIEEVILKGIEYGDIQFSTKNDFENDFDIYYIAVGTHQTNDGSLDIQNVRDVLDEIVSKINRYCVILIKSTLSVGDCEKLQNEFKNKTNVDFDIVYNPEFFSQGKALIDFLNPQRIVISNTSQKAFEVINELYKTFEKEIIQIDSKSAELAKLACDSYLGVKISFINEIANLAGKTGADISAIKKVLMTDYRIGCEFLNEGIGFGGQGLTKSMSTILYKGNKLKTDLNTVKGAKITNETQKRLFISEILKFYNYNVENKVFCIWGLSFKENCSDIRESASTTLIDTLTRYGAVLRAYDPKTSYSNVKQYKTKEDALQSSNALIILTPWEEFKNVDFEFISNNLTDNVIFDARNLYLGTDFSKYNLKYNYIGKNND